MQKMRISGNYADPHRRILSEALFTVHKDNKNPTAIKDLKQELQKNACKQIHDIKFVCHRYTSKQFYQLHLKQPH